MPGHMVCCDVRDIVHGRDVMSPRGMLGHAGLEMTNRYVHFAAQELAAIQERVAPMDKLDIRPMKVPQGNLTGCSVGSDRPA